MNSTEFRKELTKIMPGYKWTVHRRVYFNRHIDATGIQSKGLNRISTLHVIRREKKEIRYTVKSSGFGTNAPWLEKCEGETLAKALRYLQERYEVTASNYGRHAADLERGRKEA